MGQYYMPLLIGSDKKILRFYSHNYNNGLKLMEHSWVGNNFVNAVLGYIKDNPMRVAWVGDYSDSVENLSLAHREHCFFLLYFHFLDCIQKLQC